tara:strand:+ start:261804 stop:262031 length:228 start_codon:yes stop_codon:yes gene_type:complete
MVNLRRNGTGNIMAHRKLAGLALATLTLPFLSGCIATTAVGLAAETVEAGVEITGAVIGTGVDLVTTSEDERDDD